MQKNWKTGKCDRWPLFVLVDQENVLVSSHVGELRKCRLLGLFLLPVAKNLNF